jgi:hypothetical protein
MNLRSAGWLLRPLLIIAAYGLNLIGGPVVAAQPALVKVAYTESQDINDPTYYYQQLLVLALEKTRESHGEYQISYADKIESTDRIHNQVKIGQQANLVWGSVTLERANVFEVVPFDILRGYNSFRLLLVNEKNINIFAKVRNRKDFLGYKAGNGSNWTDTRILKDNGIRVVTSVNFDNLLKMLVAGRFDYISRGLHEIHNDVLLYGGLGYPVAIDNHLLLEYQQPVAYSFLVNKQSTKLAKRLAEGLKLAEADGSYPALFNSIPAFQRATAELAKERVHIRIDNTRVLAPAMHSAP